MPKDTKTRYQGIYARHRMGCTVEQDRTCNCSPSYWGQVWDRAASKPRKTKAVRTIAEARNARADLEASLRAGTVPTSGTMRVAKAIEAYLTAIEAGTALNKHGRPYKPSAIRDLRGALETYVQPALGGHRLADVRRGDVQRLVDSMTPEVRQPRTHRGQLDPQPVCLGAGSGTCGGRPRRACAASGNERDTARPCGDGR